MSGRQKLGEVAHLAQHGRLKEAQRLADSIGDAELKRKAQDVIDSVIGVRQ